VDWLVSDHIKLFLKVTVGTGQAICVLTVCALSSFVVTTALTGGVIYQACFAFFRSLAIFGAAIHVDMENHAPKP
jgi:hypothetical protein